MPGDVEWGLKVSARDLDRHSNKSTRGLILCSPCNPTGAVYTLAELKAIAEWAKAEQGLDHLGRDLSPDQLRQWSGAVAPRSARRAARASGHHLRGQQGLRDDRLANRRGPGTASPDQGDGGAPVAYHDGRQSSRPVGRGDGVHRRADRRRSDQDGRRVPPPPRLSRRAVPSRSARHRIRRAARSVLLLLPRGRNSGEGPGDRELRSASS